MKILIHTSKTMKQKSLGGSGISRPQFLEEARTLMEEVKRLSDEETSKIMHISPKLASAVVQAHSQWTDQLSKQSMAVDTFIGDIYSGLQVSQWTGEDRKYAQDKLCILSGLYGMLRPNDGIMPYRLEMGYVLKGPTWKNLYEFWAPLLKTKFNPGELIINLSAVEYTKALLPHLDNVTVISPRFLTVSPKTGVPVFVVVHAKIARGAFASWLIRHKIDRYQDLASFNDLGYCYDEDLSTESVPVYVCKKFAGIGLSVRLS